MEKIGCAILAGGKNRRMGGRDKAFIRIEGIPIIERIVMAVTPIFDEIIVISNNPGAYSNYSDLMVSPDNIPGKGPLGGLYTALSLTHSDAVFVIACDMPDVETTMMRSLCDFYRRSHGQAVVPRHQSQTLTNGLRTLEPLFAIYPKILYPVVESMIHKSKDISMMRLLKNVPVAYYDLPSDLKTYYSFRNLNTYG